MTHRLMGLGICLLGLSLLFPARGISSTMKSDLPEVGDPAPAFLYTDLDTGVHISFEMFERNRPVVLVFLQTACRSCQREMAALKRLKEEQGTFGVLAVFLDMTQRNLKKYVADNHLPFTFTWDSSNAISEAYGVTFTPASFLLDGERRVVKIYRGFHAGIERTLEADLKSLTAP